MFSTTRARVVRVLLEISIHLSVLLVTCIPHSLYALSCENMHLITSRIYVAEHFEN